MEGWDDGTFHYGSSDGDKSNGNTEVNLKDSVTV